MLTLTNGTPLTATEAKMLSLLSDGQRHPKQELHALLWDEEADKDSSVHCHMSRLRKKLRAGLHISCEAYQRSYHYRLVRLVGDARKKDIASKSLVGAT
jgi:DNA-binding response OmpR family regulator